MPGLWRGTKSPDIPHEYSDVSMANHEWNRALIAHQRRVCVVERRRHGAGDDETIHITKSRGTVSPF